MSLSYLKEKSKRRRQLLAKQFGVSNTLDKDKDGSKQERLTNAARKYHEGQETSVVVKKSAFVTTSDQQIKTASEVVTVTETATNKQGKEHEDCGDVAKEGSFYVDSSLFLKGTISANPHNDFCQYFVDTGERPQNLIQDVDIDMRFSEFPKLKELIRLKDNAITSKATPPMYLKCDLRCFDLRTLKIEFDVILVDPPLKEYRHPGMSTSDLKYWDLDDVEKLNIGAVTSHRSFVFLWCGSCPEGLEKGRKCLRSWGFRRCEDICWVKTNKNKPEKGKPINDPKRILQRTKANGLLKEHCLMGIKGTVRRSVDGDFIHANVDIDLIITEEMSPGSFEKPTEIFHIIEHFCLGRRRLHIFGRDSTIRPGWVTIGQELSTSNFSSDKYLSNFVSEKDYLVEYNPVIEALRPKSPSAKTKMVNSILSGRARGGPARLTSNPNRHSGVVRPVPTRQTKPWRNQGSSREVWWAR